MLQWCADWTGKQQRALSGEINLTVSKPILDEMADVLVRKFDVTPAEVVEDGPPRQS